MKQYLLIDLYTGQSNVIDEQTARQWKVDAERTKGDRIVWRGEEHILVQL